MIDINVNGKPVTGWRMYVLAFLLSLSFGGFLVTAFVTSLLWVPVIALVVFVGVVASIIEMEDGQNG